MKLAIPQDWRGRIRLLLLVGVVIGGGVGCGLQLGKWLAGWRHGAGPYFGAPQPRPRPAGLTVSKRPGPPRPATVEFILGPEVPCMQALADRSNERWRDVLDNAYAPEFVARFRYDRGAPDGPQVRVRLAPRGLTLSGRLEARGLKPNFAYQLKLKGDFAADRHGFEQIGRIGRWRLPGRGTNYSDADYAACTDAEKAQVEAYILFDYFVTDARGDAVRDFDLDSSLHVLWLTTQYSSGVPTDDLLLVTVNASDPAVYAQPQAAPASVGVWAEREYPRYVADNQVIRLPPHAYRAALALTEESFHASDSEGGWWATVMYLPVTFEIVE